MDQNSPVKDRKPKAKPSISFSKEEVVNKLVGEVVREMIRQGKEGTPREILLTAELIYEQSLPKSRTKPR